MILCEECGRPIKDRVDLSSKSVLCPNCVQSHVGFINMLESICKRNIINKMLFKDVYYEWYHMGKPKNLPLRRAKGLKRPKKGIITDQEWPILYPVLDKDKFPVSWEDLL
ncbi:MAG: zinc finger domain-containing protein [Candidatus Odinarchaeia archaeon]